jgi:hypothetical protein
MATNKKKAAKNKPEKAVKTSTSSSTTATPAPRQNDSLTNHPPRTAAETKQGGLFLSAQFTALVLLAMGMSRLLEVQAVSLSTVETPSARCLVYLGDIACRDPTLQKLLSFKFQFIFPTTATVLLFMLRSWRNEAILGQINGLLVLSPIMAGMAVLLGNLSVISYQAAKSQCVIGVVLALLAMPPDKKNQPFTNQRVAPWQSIPSMVLAIMAMVSIGQAILCLLDSYDRFNVVGLLPWPAHLVVDVPAARPILQFFAVDYLLLGLLYAYGWHSFPDQTQRVRYHYALRT